MDSVHRQHTIYSIHIIPPNITSADLNTNLAYNFESNFNCLVGDNATNNDKKLIRLLNRESATLCLGVQHRIRCAGHIIDLVVKATLYDEGVS